MDISIFRKLIGLWLGLILIAGCDGYYHLVPYPGEEAFAPNKTTNTLAVIESGHLTATIGGGTTQQPFTKKVKATGLTTRLTVESDRPFTYYTLSPSILTGSGTDIAAAYLGIYLTPAGSKKGKQIVRLWRREKDIIDSLAYTFDAGRAAITYSFSSYYDSLGLIQFPIFLEAGMVVCGEDTLSLQRLKFDAAVFPDKYGK